MSVEIERKLRKFCYEGNTEGVREILDSSPEIIDAVDDTLRRSALIISVNNNQVDVVRLLLDYGARFDLVDLHGRNAYSYATELENHETRQIILPLACFEIIFILESNQEKIRRLETNDPFLTELILVDTYIGDKGAEIIGEALKRNTSIQKLILVGNNICDTGALSIVNGLSGNPTINYLDLIISLA